jgi:hypothetical protein
VGYVALGIGFLVGFAIAATGPNSVTAGILAVLITAGSIVLGKFLMVEMQLMTIDTPVISAMSNEDFQGYFADQIVREREEAGKPVQLAEVDPENFDAATYYPPEIWAEAKNRHSKATSEELAAIEKKTSEEFSKAFNGFKGAMRWEAFKESFGILDIVFFVIAIATSWGTAARSEQAA